MNKSLILMLYLTIIFLISGCVNIHPKIPSGRWESEIPKMYIDFDGAESTRSGVSKHSIDVGELFTDDGTATKIFYKDSHGAFNIFEFEEDEEYGVNSTILFSGEYKLKGDTLTLKMNDGSEIVLNKVEDIQSST